MAMRRGLVGISGVVGRGGGAFGVLRGAPVQILQSGKIRTNIPQSCGCGVRALGLRCQSSSSPRSTQHDFGDVRDILQPTLNVDDANHRWDDYQIELAGLEEAKNWQHVLSKAEEGMRLAEELREVTHPHTEPQILFAKAKALHKLGRHEEAVRTANESMPYFDKGNVTYKKMLLKSFIADVYTAQNRLREAVEIQEEIMKWATGPARRSHPIESSAALALERKTRATLGTLLVRGGGNDGYDILQQALRDNAQAMDFEATLVAVDGLREYFEGKKDYKMCVRSCQKGRDWCRKFQNVEEEQRLKDLESHYHALVDEAEAIAAGRARPEI